MFPTPFTPALHEFRLICCALALSHYRPSTQRIVSALSKLSAVLSIMLRCIVTESASLARVCALASVCVSVSVCVCLCVWIECRAFYEKFLSKVSLLLDFCMLTSSVCHVLRLLWFVQIPARRAVEVDDVYGDVTI